MPGFLLLSLLFIIKGESANATSPSLQELNFVLCGPKQEACLTIKAPHGEFSQFQNVMSLASPLVHGLGFESREISSVIIDLVHGVAFLRERRNKTYLGEWTVNLDTLKIDFYEAVAFSN